MEEQRGASARLASDDLSAIASLDEPVRRRLYDYVGERRTAIGRDEAAKVLGLTRSTAAFHLDKLVEEGLLTAEFARLTGRTGPGSGRPSKLYRRSERVIELSLPGRRYELVGRLLADAIVESGQAGGTPNVILDRRARELGRDLGGQTAEGGLLGCLDRFGFEPRLEHGVIRLGNCPFHSLAAKHTDLVCGMNLGLLDGVVDGVGAKGYRADLDPEDGYCCVRLRPTGEGAEYAEDSEAGPACRCGVEPRLP